MSGLRSDSSATLSLSEAMKKSSNEMLFRTLLNNPEKRAQVLELLTQEGIVGRDENLSPNSAKSNKYNSPIKKLQKKENALNGSPKSNIRMESPSALGRRRALKRLESDSSTEEPPQKPTSPPFVGTPKQFERLLEGVVAYCEIRSNGEDRSSAVKTMMRTMGATVKENLCRGVTHVILKDGYYMTYNKAKLLKIHIVSVLWLEAVRKHKFRVPESKFPAVCADAYKADITKICQDMQKDYDDVIQEELNNTTEIDTRRHSETPRKYVTNRKKSRATIYGSDTSGFKDAHNRTEIASPYKHKCNEPELSESDSYISVGSVTRPSLEIVPCSQDHPTSLSIHHAKSPELTKVVEEDSDEIVPESNLAKNIKDSFELEKASKIRSPESLLNQSKQKDLINRNKNSLENDSLRLHISTTDESNLNSTGNKSKSSNANSSKNLLDDITPIISHSSSDSRRKISSDDVNFNLHISSSNPMSSSENNIDNLPNNNLENSEQISRPGSSISTTNSDIDINKNKTRRRTTVGLKRPAKKDIELDNLNQAVANKTPTIKLKIPKKNPVTSCIETNDGTVDNKKQNVVKRNPRRQTMYKLNNTEIEENKPKKSRRKSVAKVNSEKKTQSDETNEEIEKNNSEVDNQSTTRKSRRKTISEEKKQKEVAKSNEEDKNNNPTSSDSSLDKTKRRARKLYNPNQSISASQINWDDEPDPEPKTNSVSPPKKGKYQVVIALPKVLSSKAQEKVKSTIKNTTKSTPAKPKNVNFDNKNKRMSVRALKFNSTSSESSDLDLKSVNPVVQTPSRRSERIAKTPSKTVKIADSGSEAEKNTNKSSDNELSDSSVTKRNITPRIRKSRFISSQETESSQSKTQPKSARKTQLVNDESKRRSTLDFVPQTQKKTAEQIRLSQKPKQPAKLPSIACTRFHKTDVNVFQQIVKKLGGFVVEDEVTKRTTHLIAGGPVRTVNMLRAIARGLWIVKQEWLYKSLEAGKWLEEEDFELTEFSPTVQKCRIMKQSFGSSYSMDLFNSCGPIFISRGCTPRFSDLEELVELCGGRFVRILKDAQIIVGEYATHENVVCVNEKWILDSITQNKIKKCKAYLLNRPRLPVL